MRSSKISIFIFVLISLFPPACSVPTEDLTTTGRLYPGPCIVTDEENRELYSYGDDELLDERAFDHGADGTIDYRFLHTYSAGLLETTMFTTGEDKNGVVWRYARDGEGRPLEEQ